MKKVLHAIWNYIVNVGEGRYQREIEAYIKHHNPQTPADIDNLLKRLPRAYL